MRKIPKILAVAILLVTVFVLGWIAKDKIKSVNTQNIPLQIAEKLKPLEKYQIENLSKKEIKSGKITIEGENLSKDEAFDTHLFLMEFDPILSGDNLKKTSGLVHVPNEDGKYPIVIMFRGYIDQTIYKSGVGTQRAGEYFAKNGFITISPDFLGYAKSDKEAESIFESRFQTYTTALTLLSSINQIEGWDGENVFIWGHSNGGQIALTVLEITGREVPTTLWAPVSKPFPYSILFYTDESDDRGKLIRRELAKLEEDYDVEKYSLVNYLDRINAPLQVHQGTADDAVPIDWTNTFVKNLEKHKKDVNYYTYPGADHNLQPSWNVVVSRDLSFFNEHLK